MSVRPILARAPALLALLLWFGATFYFLGDTGKYSDDYGVAMRDRITGNIDLSRHPWVRWPWFWRPIHLAHCSAINTISWNHPWIGHLELAIVQGAVAWMLARLLIRLGIRRSVAYCTSLVFMTCPLLAEAALWSSASCNAISCLFLLYTLELARRQTIGPESHLRTIAIFLLAFITACWYEPGAAALAAAPAVCFVSGTLPLLARAMRALRCAFAAGLGCLLYAVLLVRTSPPNKRGGPDSLIGLHDALPQLRLIARAAGQALFGDRARDVILGSIEHGWATLHTPAGLIFGAAAVLLLGAAAFCAAFMDPTPAPSPRRFPPTPTTRGGILLIGLAMFLGAWIPVAVVHSPGVELRTLYVPLLGLAVIAAGLASGIAGALDSASPGLRRAIAIPAAATALAFALAGTIGMIGFQAVFKLTAIRDRRVVEQLMHLVPNPPPDTLFLTLSADTRTATTGRPAFDHAIGSAFQTSWYPRAIVHWIYRRTDITATPLPWKFTNLGPDGLTILRDPARTTWEQCIPYTIGPDGDVRLLRRLTIVPADAQPFVLSFPRVPNDAPADDTGRTRLREVEHGTPAAHSTIDHVDAPPS